MTPPHLSRRRLLIGGAAAAAGALSLAGWESLALQRDGGPLVRSAEALTRTTQRLLQGRDALAREYGPAEISSRFYVNGTAHPDSADYARLLKSGFADWRLRIDGLVAHPLTLSLADLKALPARDQITRHDCVEGWSAIAQWTGVPLGAVLQRAGVLPRARYAVFYCADELEKTFDGSGRYYESLDMTDAFHPQTLLAYGMNGADLSIGHGAPLRLRVARQLGYKSAKFLMRIALVENFSDIWGGQGGYWEDRGYAWYAGI
ncbi:molybdopterin-binding protein [Thioclava sp. BHET1]|nr:molybdopterin-binding protein [Thioclava sp. BHET1]